MGLLDDVISFIKVLIGIFIRDIMVVKVHVITV